ncbi:MAG: MgtC/SapB family protein [Deinococcales bacterium]
MDSKQVILSFLVAVLLGFLIGLERERKRETQGSIFAGIRTFPLIALFGAIVGTLSWTISPWVLVGSFVPVAVLIALAYWRETAGTKVGGTTQFAVLVAYGLGVMAGYGAYVAALAGAVVTTGMLSLRTELRRLAGAVSQEDLYAVVQFAVVSLVVLPLVPNETFGPWGVWNPRTIWWLVVLISGLSFIGYAASKVIGATRGIGWSGLLGGLASSTAVTMSFSERSKKQQSLDIVYAIGVLAASAVMIPRLWVLLGVLQPRLILPTLIPLGVLFVITTIGGLSVLRERNRERLEGARVTNPFQLKTALQFALLFALILLLAKAAEEYLGTRGLYIASALAGVTQLDAITLTLAHQVGTGLDVNVAARGLAIAAATNSLFKAGLALVLGSRRFGRSVLATLFLAAVGCIAAAWLLPSL